jgi:molecular chaperone HscB
MGNKAPRTRSTAEENVCWACRRENGAGHLCRHCSVLQPLRNSETHFSVFGLAPRLNLDASSLQRVFYDLSRNYHPDFYQTRTPKEKSISEAATAMINTAYETLKDPSRRVEYLLDLEGMPVDRVDSKPPMDLFEEILSVQEMLGDYREAKLSKTHGLDQAKAAILKVKKGLESRGEELKKKLEVLSLRWDDWLDSSSTVQPTDLEKKKNILTELRNTLGEIAYLRTVLRDIQKTIGTEG